MVELTKEEITVRIAKNVAKLVESVAGEKSFVLNLGVGMPTEVSNYITKDNIFIQAENGMLGVGPLAKEGEGHPMLINAGRQLVTETCGCSYLDSSMSFGMIRGGYVDATVLGAFEVDEEANVANWIIPGGKQLGVGGAMDLVAGANRVIIAMTHTNKGKAKIIPKCTLPITGVHEVDYIVTEMAAFAFINGKLTMIMKAPDFTMEEIAAATGIPFDCAETVETMVG